MKGLFITFEGIDGCGKSTQIKLISDYLESKGFEIIHSREPGGSPIGEQIRNVLLDINNKGMSDRTECLLYAASRVQHIDEVIRPAIESGKMVLCDRFIDSSIAYQGYGRNLGECFVRNVNSYVENCMPDITFYYRLDVETSRARISCMNRQLDRLEQENINFFNRVVDGYDGVAASCPDRVVTIDATMSIEDIFNESVKIIDNYLEVLSK